MAPDKNGRVAKKKQPGKALKTGPACAPFRDHLADVELARPRPTSWSQVEAGFLRAMEEFDAAVVAGRASEGERQNGKGDYLNELLALLIEASVGVTLNRRTGVKGLVFPDYNLDVTFPDSGVAELLIEAKTMGTPKHPGSEQANPEGRPASADLPKRLREAGFKTIDLKAGYGLERSKAGEAIQAGPSGDLTGWLRQAKPASFVLIAARITDEADRQRLINDCTSMTKVMDGMGLYCFGAADPTSSIPVYSRAKVPPLIELDRTLHQICERLRHAG